MLPRLPVSISGRVSADTTQPLFLHQLAGHSRAVDAAQFSKPDGSQAITAGKDNTIRIWEIVQAHATAAGAAGAEAGAGAGAGADLESPAAAARTPVTHEVVATCSRVFGETSNPNYPREPFAIWSMAALDLAIPSMHGGSSTLMVAAAGDTTTPVLWDVCAREICCEFAGHFKLVQGIAASSCGSFLVTGSYDQTVRIFDLQRLLPWSEATHRRLGNVCNAVIFTILCCEVNIVVQHHGKRGGDGISSAAGGAARRNNVLPIELWIKIFRHLRGVDFANEGRHVEGPKAIIPGADRFSLFGNKGLCYGSYYG